MQFRWLFRHRLLAWGLGWAGLWLAPAQAAERLLWLTSDAPPIVIKDGPLKGRGYVDRLLAEVLIPGLPGWDHQVTLGSSSRVMRELEEQSDVCAPAISRTPERATVMLFSLPWLRFLPAGLVLRHADAEARPGLLNAHGEVSLHSYLGGPAAQRLGVMAKRVYGPGVDPLLQKYEAQVRLVPVAGSNLSLMAMVAQNRGIDGTLAYGFELTHFESQSPEWAGQLQWLPLQEQAASLFGYVACSRSAQGERVMAAINALLQKPGVRERAQRLYEEWLDAASRQRLQQRRQALARPEDFWAPGELSLPPPTRVRKP